ncbi:response regulator [Taibaiella koreensis]|uniref:response regulator n=1 Tax=Taibaiella koreensis TaxID=1268548 RepID=UPI000E59BEBA|nr:response regulator transcription factor [Taibaiella koreensis]
MKRILLADDHEIVRFGLRIMLGDAFPGYIIDEAFDGESVLSRMKHNNYDLLLLDMVMPDTDSNALLQQLRNVHSQTKVLILSVNDEAFFGTRAIELGAKGYLKKDASKEEIRQAIDTVMAGKKYVSSKLADALVQNVLGEKTANPIERLSSREFQVAMYIIQDFSQREISEMLNIQYGTVNTMKQRIYEKLNIKQRRELIELAAAHGLK